MQSSALRRSLTTALAASLLCASVGLAESGARTVPSKAQPTQRQNTARKEMPFKTERTDSWLCTYISPFFCSNLIPSLPSGSSGNTVSSNVPDRSRHD